MKPKISTKFDTPKYSAAVFVKCEDKILLKKYQFQGISVCGATLGAFIEEGEDPIGVLKGLLKEELDISMTPKFIFNMTSYINKPKPDGRVRLKAAIYLLEIDQETKRKIKTTSQSRWMGLKKINESEYIREDDKFTFSRFLNNDYRDFIQDVDQMGKWGHARLISCHEA